MGRHGFAINPATVRFSFLADARHEPVHISHRRPWAEDAMQLRQ